MSGDWVDHDDKNYMFTFTDICAWVRWSTWHGEGLKRDGPQWRRIRLFGFWRKLIDWVEEG